MRIQRLLPEPSFANVMSSIAVFIALGGGAYAAVTLKANQVKSANIASKQITARHIKPGAVTSVAIRDRSVRIRDLNPEIASAKGILGPQGPQGPQGPPGAPGVDGAGLALHATRVSLTLSPHSSSGVLPDAWSVSWTQPPGALDELSGEWKIRWAPPCALMGAIEFRMVADGATISPSTPAGTNDGNSTPFDGVGDKLQIQRPSGMSIPAGTYRSDIQPLPIERPWFAPPSAATTHTVTIQADASGCGAVGVPYQSPLLDLDLYVKRFRA